MAPSGWRHGRCADRGFFPLPPYAVEPDPFRRVSPGPAPDRSGGDRFLRSRIIRRLHLLRSGRIGARARHLRDPSPDRTDPAGRPQSSLSRLLDRRSSENGLQEALPPDRGVAQRRLATAHAELTDTWMHAAACVALLRASSMVAAR